jgi:hypothetical protein
MPRQPTAATEFRRGLNAFNVMVGVVSSAALGVGTLGATAIGAVPDLLGLGAGPQALAAALGLFVLITALHTAAHTYLGWRFDRGIRAADAGEHRRAVRLLTPVEGRGMSHYDPDGAARRALDVSRRQTTGELRAPAGSD